MPSDPPAPRRSRDLPHGALAAVVALVVGLALFRFLVGMGMSLPFGLGESDDPSRTIFFSFVAVAILIVLSIAVARVRQDRVSAGWPQTSARIVKSGIETRTRRFENEPQSTFDLPDVEYEFTVGGTHYRGARVRLDGENSEEDAQTVAARYTVGSTVPVIYDPKDPSNCMLERGNSKGLLQGCLILLAILAVIVWLGREVLTLLGRLPHSNPPLVLMAGFFALVMIGAFFASKPRLSTDLEELKRQSAGWIALVIGLGCLYIATRATGLVH